MLAIKPLRIFLSLALSSIYTTPNLILASEADGNIAVEESTLPSDFEKLVGRLSEAVKAQREMLSESDRTTLYKNYLATLFVVDSILSIGESATTCAACDSAWEIGRSHEAPASGLFFKSQTLSLLSRPLESHFSSGSWGAEVSELWSLCGNTLKADNANEKEPSPLASSKSDIAKKCANDIARVKYLYKAHKACQLALLSNPCDLAKSAAWEDVWDNARYSAYNVAFEEVKKSLIPDEASGEQIADLAYERCEQLVISELSAHLDFVWRSSYDKSLAILNENAESLMEPRPFFANLDEVVAVTDNTTGSLVSEFKALEDELRKLEFDMP